MAEWRLRYGWIWLVYLAITFVGAGMLFSPNEGDDVWGIAIMMSPLVIFIALTLAYYLKNRSFESE